MPIDSKSPGRPEFHRAADECERRLRGILDVEGVDDAAVVASLMRIAAHMHLQATEEDPVARAHGPDEIRAVFAHMALVSYDRAQTDRKLAKETN